jgi:hypothetical protein
LFILLNLGEESSNLIKGKRQHSMQKVRQPNFAQATFKERL